MVYKLILLFFAGIGAGFFNIMAGGGSLLTMPALIFLGLPASVANGTNRIALLAQNVFATANFKRSGFFYWKTGLILMIPASIGAIIGSILAVRIPDDIFEKILAVVMVVSLVVVLTKKKREYSQSDQIEIKKYLPLIVSFFFIGIYGGMIQAGVGYLIILTLSMIPKINLVQVNSLKIFIVLFYMIPSILVFALNGKINLVYGLILACGNSLGGWIGVNVAVKKGDKIIKVIFSIAVLAMAFKLIGLY